jgi:hypothetical protein
MQAAGEPRAGRGFSAKAGFAPPARPQFASAPTIITRQARAIARSGAHTGHA